MIALPDHFTFQKKRPTRGWAKCERGKGGNFTAKNGAKGEKTVVLKRERGRKMKHISYIKYLHAFTRQKSSAMNRREKKGFYKKKGGKG